MNCCCPHSRSAGRFFSLFARRYRKRFEHKGFEPSQKQLIEGLDAIGYRENSILEIGSGVGHLHQTLLERGARSAVGVDLAPKMLAEARRWADERALGERVDYLEGDFVDHAGEIERADIAILDKVICCYPNAGRLVRDSLAKTRRGYAFTVPRERWFVRLAVGTLAFAMRILCSKFRPYVHDIEGIDTLIVDAGFEQHFEASTAFWLTRVYQRAV